MDSRPERPLPNPVSEQYYEGVYDQEDFRILLEHEIDRATILAANLSLLVVKPAGQVTQAGLEIVLTKITNIINKAQSSALIGNLEDHTIGIALLETDPINALQIAAGILDESPVSLGIGHAILSTNLYPIDLYDTATSALSEALSNPHKSKKGRIVTLLHPGQKLDRADLPPRNIWRGVATLKHK